MKQKKKKTKKKRMIKKEEKEKENKTFKMIDLFKQTKNQFYLCTKIYDQDFMFF